MKKQKGKPQMKKIIAITLSVIMACCCLGITASSDPDMSTDGHGIGMSIDGFSTIDMYGHPVTSSILENADVTIINYWATWCGPCVGEMPDLQEAHEYWSANPDLGIQILGAVSYGNGCTHDSALAFLENNGITYINIEPDGILDAVFSRNGYIPQTLVVDSTGRVWDHVVGAFNSYEDVIEFADMWHEVILNADQECTITFIDGSNNEVITTMTCPIGSIVEDLDMPEAPEHEGMRFKEWVFSDNLYETSYDPFYHLVLGDITVTANYEYEKYKVKFYDGVTGYLITIRNVEYGHAAVAPVHPEHDGYIFDHWDADFSCITGPLDVHGVCYMLGDGDGDGVLTLNDAISAMRVALGSIEYNAIYDYDQNGTVDLIDVIAIMRTVLNVN